MTKGLFYICLFLAIECILLSILLFPLSFSRVMAAVGENAIVQSGVSIGNSGPEIINITINDGNDIDLTANSTTLVNVYAVIRDYNGEDDLANLTSEFFDASDSFYGDTDDNNNHYTNTSCLIDTAYGDSNEANVTCTFALEYYANNATWNASMLLFDNSSLSFFSSSTKVVNTLLAVGLPDSIDYGLINSTFVSLERIANVTNFGNVYLNLSLEGYAITQGDGLAMNCTLGSTQNIPVYYEKYNLTSSNDSILNLEEFESLYSNLSSSATVRTFNLPSRTDDLDLEGTINSTYWRIYVPPGAAGSCEGNIIFGATQAPGI